MLLFPYARFQIRTGLSEEEVCKRIMLVIQPPKTGAKAVVFEARPDNDTVVFQGHVLQSCFLLRRLKCCRKEGCQFSPQIKGSLLLANGEAKVLIQIYPSWPEIIVYFVNFFFWGCLLISAMHFGGAYEHWDIVVPYLLMLYVILLVSPVSTEVRATRQTLTQLLQDQSVKVMMR
jgi:hypothetical protein